MIKKLFRQMLLTQIVSSMTVTLCMLIDSIMIGRFLGVNAMSAYGLASPLLLVFAALGSLISSGFDNCLLHPYKLVPPVIILVLLMIACNLISDGLREALDPANKR